MREEDLPYLAGRPVEGLGRATRAEIGGRLLERAEAPEELLVIGAPARDVGGVGGLRGARGDLGQLGENDRLLTVVVDVQETVEAAAELGEAGAITAGTGAPATRT